jgi:hypothetical protein
LALKRYPKDPIKVALEEAQNTDISDTDLVDLLEKSKMIIQREVQNLLILSAQGKLKVRESESLVQYTKLLNQLVKEEQQRADEDKS